MMVLLAFFYCTFQTSAYLTEGKSAAFEITTIDFFDAANVSSSSGLYFVNKTGKLVPDKSVVPIAVTITNTLHRDIDVRLLGISFTNGITAGKITNESFHLPPGASNVISIEGLDGKNLFQGTCSGNLELEFSLNPNYSLRGSVGVGFELKGMK